MASMNRASPVVHVFVEVGSVWTVRLARMPPVTEPDDAPLIVALSSSAMTAGSMSARTVDSSPRTRCMSCTAISYLTLNRLGVRVVTAMLPPAAMESSLASIAATAGVSTGTSASPIPALE